MIVRQNDFTTFRLLEIMAVSKTTDLLISWNQQGNMLLDDMMNSVKAFRTTLIEA